MNFNNKAIKIFTHNGFSIVLATLVLTPPPLLLNARKYFYTFDQSHSKERACQLIESAWVYFEMIQVLPCYRAVRNIFS